MNRHVVSIGETDFVTGREVRVVDYLKWNRDIRFRVYELESPWHAYQDIHFLGTQCIKHLLFQRPYNLRVDR